MRHLRLPRWWKHTLESMQQQRKLRSELWSWQRHSAWMNFAQEATSSSATSYSRLPDSRSSVDLVGFNEFWNTWPNWDWDEHLLPNDNERIDQPRILRDQWLATYLWSLQAESWPTLSGPAETRTRLTLRPTSCHPDSRAARMSS